MQAPYHTQPVQDAGSIRKQQVRFYLMVGGSGLLLIWFSIGRTPSTWTLWFQLIRQLHMFQVQSGAYALLTLALVSVQSLLLLGAWALLLYVIVREGSRLHAAPARPDQVEQQAAPVLAPPPGAAVPPPPPPDMALFHTLLMNPSAMEQTAPSQLISQASASLHQSEQSEVQSMELSGEQRSVAPPFARKTHLTSVTAEGDFHRERSHREPAISIENMQTLQNSFPSHNPPTSSPWPQALHAQPAPSAQRAADNPEPPEKKLEAARLTAQPVVLEVSQNDPYSFSSSMKGLEVSKDDPYAFSSSMKEEQSRFPEWLVEGPKPNKDQDMASGPFAAGKEALESLQMTNRFPTPGPLPPAAAASAQDDGFVFGNPFDGPLPDVFEQDEALKRTITGLHSRLNQDQAPGKLSGGTTPGPQKQD